MNSDTHIPPRPYVIFPAPPRPGRDLYNAVRAALLLRETSFTAWCRAEGIHHQNASAALCGLWGGAKGRAMCTRIIKSSGIEVRREH